MDFSDSGLYIRNLLIYWEYLLTKLSQVFRMIKILVKARLACTNMDHILWI